MAAYRKRMIPQTLLSDEKINNFSSSESLGLGNFYVYLIYKTFQASQKQYFILFHSKFY